MKKMITLALIVALILPGCAAQETQPSLSAELQKEEQIITPVKKPAQALPQEVTENPTLTEEAEATENESVDAEIPDAAETKPESPKKEESSAPKTQQSNKEETTQTPSKTEPAQTPPKTENTQNSNQTPTNPSKPSASVGPTSSATGKDTGSNAIWDDPDAGTPDLYQESDPQRTSYLEYLKTGGNEWYYWLREFSMQMHPGRSYGMPLYTSYEVFVDSTWTSSNESVATVNELGYVTAHQVGSAVISVSYCNPETQIVTTRECDVTVVERPVYTIAQLEQLAHKKAKEIANYAMNYSGATTDLERIAVATAKVHEYVKRTGSANTYKIENGTIVSYPITGYNQPFGTLVTAHSSCAGDTRAMGLVLEYMGFQWYHVNANQWDHQWCVVYNVDGQTAFADASKYGMVGYGQQDTGNAITFNGSSFSPL